MPIKIAIIHPKIGRGGSEATVLWMIDSLKKDYDVSLITGAAINLFELNKFYGTNLHPDDFSVIVVPMPFGLGSLKKFAAVRGRFIQRYCQKNANDFNLMINAYNPCNFKKPGIQFATDIAELPTILSLSGLKKIFYSQSILRKLYLKICDLISVENPKDWKNNLTLSNSLWTADLMKQKYGIESEILYPPVKTEFAGLAKKEIGFVCIGRIVAEKRFDQIINILEKVRALGNDIHLHIIGKFGKDNYSKLLKRKCFEQKKWIFIEDGLSEQEKNNLVRRHLFGISARQNEPFGIAVAEMVKAGCIVFVPACGGQTEIVKNNNLIYKNNDDAVIKIINVLQNENLKKEILSQIPTMADKFSVENFQKQIKKFIADWLFQNG